VVHQTAASEFERLYAHLEGAGLQVYDRIDTSLEELPVRRKDIVEIDARLRVSGLHALTDLMRMFGQAAPLIQQFGAGEQIDAEVLAGVQALTALNENSSTVSLIGTVHGDASVSLAFELQTSGMRTESWDVEATALVKVQRLLRPGQSEVAGDPFGGLMRLCRSNSAESFCRACSLMSLPNMALGPRRFVTRPLLELPSQSIARASGMIFGRLLFPPTGCVRQRSLQPEEYEFSVANVQWHVDRDDVGSHGNGASWKLDQTSGCESRPGNRRRAR
jgi:hypothetical protein